ncbi:phosphoglucosamine mutase [Sporolactobacillus inulinus]|uniref:Phosphoglucosamine mutase n=1 Tax=Sporolactobacillus inulinus TaxID=2078 RepID=A0A4Y1ZH69_9BACL|nr:phosphoglucosamine mutase [Sporolactobacillus inulinus]
MRLGVVSTPGVAYLTKAMDASAGIMISASHNPVEDNGIKFFGSDGFKLSDEVEETIETLLAKDKDDLPRPIGGDLGVSSDYFEGGQKYLQFLKQTIQEEDFSTFKIALDCAHGSTSALAPHLFADLEADIVTIGTSPNGKNINAGVGSTHPEALSALVVEKAADVGLAFDGDGDRLIAVDELGNIIDGDKIMYICATYLKSKGHLTKDTLVTTVMSNLGLYKALQTQQIETKQTKVGDRYVMEEMRDGGYVLGGEQSGHIIFLEHSTTGDGMLTALQLVNIMKVTGKKLSELATGVKTYPQKLVNIKVADKFHVTENPEVAAVIKDVETDMAGDGRVLVRPSGTESLIRVMAEAPTEEACDAYVERIAQKLLKRSAERFNNTNTDQAVVRVGPVKTDLKMRCARGKRVTEATIQHRKDTSPSHRVGD